MSSAVSEEGADSTSTTTAEPEEKGSTTVEEKKTVESDADQPESAGDAVEDGETETDKTESDQQQPPDSSTDSRQEQPPSEAERNNVTASGEKRTESSEPEKPSPLQEKIIRQIEFYFGDRNFPKDKFLQQAAESNSEGWVPLPTLLTFNRLKALSSDAEVIVEAVRKSTAGIVEVSEDGKSVRRHPDKSVPDIFAADFRKEVMERSIYAKGFPEDTKLDDIQEFMERYGKVNYIQMRRLPVDKEKKFKGSIFTEFECIEDAEKFVKVEKVQFNGIDLVVEWKSDYFKRKQTERKQRKDEAKNSLMQLRKEEEKKEGEESEPVTVVKVAGCVLHFSGLSNDKSREDIREDLLPFGTVAFVDFDRGKTEGYVRFREEGGAKRAREGLLDRAVGGAGVAQLCECEVELRVLEGEEEEQYWQKVMEGSASGRERKGGRKGGRGGGRGRGRGKWGGNFRKRRERSSGDGGESGPPEPKTSKTED